MNLIRIKAPHIFSNEMQFNNFSIYFQMVRMKALQCIQLISKQIPIFKILPHKQEVVNSLLVCLDDPKRLVRKEAVNAKCNWILLDAPI